VSSKHSTTDKSTYFIFPFWTDLFNAVIVSPIGTFECSAARITNFGTIDDFKSFVVEIYNRQMRLILNFVPNHEHSYHEKIVIQERYEDFCFNLK
jgi:hypothetical protein